LGAHPGAVLVPSPILSCSHDIIALKGLYSHLCHFSYIELQPTQWSSLRTSTGVFSILKGYCIFDLRRLHRQRNSHLLGTYNGGNQPIGALSSVALQKGYHYLAEN
jgi:hypothetical protein